LCVFDGLMMGAKKNNFEMQLHVCLIVGNTSHHDGKFCKLVKHILLLMWCAQNDTYILVLFMC
jgi:hypothetical protein